MYIFPLLLLYIVWVCVRQVIVIPPLSEGNRPVLSDNAKGMLKHYISSGHNTLIVCGGPANINFINKNLLPADGGQLLEPAWTRG